MGNTNQVQQGASEVSPLACIIYFYLVSNFPMKILMQLHSGWTVSLRLVVKSSHKTHTDTRETELWRRLHTS